jgi:endo-1,4-beta-xylanase
MPNTTNQFSRRTALSLLSATLGVGLASPLEAKAPALSLAELAALKGIRFGSAVSAVEGGYTHPEVAALLIRECKIIVPENELKLYVIQKEESHYNFEPADGILGFCKSHSLTMRGHTLWWARDEYAPRWLLDYNFGKNPKIAAEKWLRDYLAQVIDHYGTNIVSWDVVNEVIDPDTGEIRDSVITRILGMDALRIVYEVAREHLPKTQLVYNDFMCWEADKSKHREGTLKLLRWFHEQKLSVDALGIQSHIGFDRDMQGGQHDTWKKFLDEVASMGYQMLITEFDVNDRYVEGTVSERDAAVAKLARDYLDITLSYKQVKDVLLWGITDKYSWLAPRKKDGRRIRGTPYDDSFQPKPLREAIAMAFRSATQR